MTAGTTETRARYFYWRDLQSRWQDGDPYGHVNNVIYYSWMDALLTAMLIEKGVLRNPDWRGIGLCVESGCRFLAPVTFPEVVQGGLRVGRIGNTSLRYDIGMFLPGRETPAAVGFFVHVFVDPDSRRPVPIPDTLKARMRELVLPAA